MTASLLSAVFCALLSAPPKPAAKPSFTVKTPPPRAWAVRLRDTVWIGWNAGTLGSPKDGWLLEGKAGKGWGPVYPGRKPVYVTQDTGEIVEPLCPPDFVSTARRAVWDHRGGVYRSATMNNAKMREEFAKYPEPMRSMALAMAVGTAAQDAAASVVLGAGAMVPDPDRKWTAFRAVPSAKGKALETAVVAPDLKVDSIREVRMVPDRAMMSINMPGLLEGNGKATLEPRTPDPSQYTLYYKAWSNASNVPGLEMSLWTKDSSGAWSLLRATGTSAPFKGLDTQFALDSVETAQVRKSVAVGFGYAVLSRLDLQRIEIPMSTVTWEKP